jgi:hypothetical protein
MTWSAAAVRNLKFFFVCWRRSGCVNFLSAAAAAARKFSFFSPVGGAVAVFISYRRLRLDSFENRKFFRK